MITSNLFVASVLSAVLSFLGLQLPNNIQTVPIVPPQEVQQSTSNIIPFNRVNTPSPSPTNVIRGDQSNVVKDDSNALTDNDKPSTANLGTISIRAIVANVDELGNRYGSMGEKFTQTKLSEVDQALQRLNTFVKQSSYGKAQLQWTTSGVYELGSGVCSHTSWSDKTNDLIQRALEAADSQSPIADRSYYLIVHPLPDCPDGTNWSFEGHGTFTAYTLNGRTVYLRGTRLSDISDEYLFHEFGHSLGYQPGMGIGHPDYYNCPVTASNSETKIDVSNTCPRVYDWNNGIVPVYTIMSATRGILSDYNAIEKETIGWLMNPNIVVAKSGKYVLSPLEQAGTAPKALKIPITGTDYTVYVSFRQPFGYTYPDAPANKPNGVIFDVTNGPLTEFLPTNNTNMDAPLQIGVPYRLGTGGPIVTLNGIANNRATITVSSGSITPPNPTQTPVISNFSSSPTLISSGQSSLLSWKVTNATRCIIQSGSSEESVSVSGSKTVTPTQTTSYKLWCVNDPGTGKDGPSADRTISVSVVSATPSAPIDKDSLISTPGTPVTLTGYAHNITQPFGISISQNGEKIWGSGNITLNGDRWVSKVDQNLTAGAYEVRVYSNNVLVTSGTLTIRSVAPTCSLTSNKSSYMLGETITYSWTSQNATYASWQQDTSGKDHLWLPGDKLSANGSQQTTASVIGNPSVTLLVGGTSGNGSCSVTVNISGSGSTPSTS
ncbi:MAG: hypothetical protein NT077_00595, partial [Candidatus Taylorbacteria bacterium]|nr:hypothetical protein [Candidatus Taylorbacteria bacterium]